MGETLKTYHGNGRGAGCLHGVMNETKGWLSRIFRHHLARVFYFNLPSARWFLGNDHDPRLVTRERQNTGASGLGVHPGISRSTDAKVRPRRCMARFCRLPAAYCFTPVTALLLLTVMAIDSAGADPARVAIGVLVHDGDHNTIERWKPTADYLSQQIPERRFVIIPHSREGMRRAVEFKELDFLLTDPGQYVDLQANYGITALLTRQRTWRDAQYSLLGAVIITRADRQDIEWMSQLKGKSFMAVSRGDFDGFQIARWELKAHDIDPFRDLSDLIFSRMPPEDIVYAVRNRRVDAGTVPTGVLERMASEGKIDLNTFRILHPQVNPEYSFARSTEHYPEWPFARTRGTPVEFARRVAQALRTMPADHPAALAGGYAGWTAPLDYQPVHELLKDLHLSPYDDKDKITVADVIHEYWSWLLVGMVFLILLGVFGMYTLRMNQRLRLSKEALRRSESALRALHGITSQHHQSFEDKILALLALGCKQFRMPIGILSHVEGENYEIVEGEPPDGPVAKGSVFPIGDTYCVKTLQSAEPIGFEHAAQSEWSTHPAYDKCKLEAYLGIRVQVAGAVYGTLNFVSAEPRGVLFTNNDKEILKLMAQWLGSEIERQRAEAHSHKLSSALEQTADSVVITNRDGVLEYVNSAFQQITGYSREEICGKTTGILKSGKHSTPFYRQLWQTILQGETYHETIINRRKNGSLYYEEKTITPLKDACGGIVNFVATGKDITKRRLAEEHLREQQAQLAHACRVSAMGEMSTALAHELNQPLTTILNYAQGCLLRLHAGEVSRIDLLTALEHIAAQGRLSGEIIRRLRDFLRTGKSSLRTRADINDIVREAVDMAGLEVRRKEITLRLELSNDVPPVLVDTIQIEQVLLNLVHNAIEAIDVAQWPRRVVVIRTSRDPRNGVEVSVQDTGPGLPEGKGESIFEAFFTTKPGGMGMGLCISRSIIETHGHQLQAIHNPDGGAIFRFMLPAVEEEENCNERRSQYFRR